MTFRSTLFLGLLVLLATVLPSRILADSTASSGQDSGAGSIGTYPGDGPMISFTGVTTNSTDGTWSLGFEFSPNTSIDVYALGFYNANLTGGAVGLSNCSGCGEVGLYNSAGTLLVSGLVTSSGTEIGDFNYVSVAPTTLVAGQDYYLLAETGNADYTWNTHGLGIDPNIDWISELEKNTPTLTFTTTGEGNPSIGWGIYGPNFEETPLTTTTVPEPSSLLLIASGLVSLGVWGRKRLYRHSV
jgi:PEP-CTERM motif-containing protein